MFRVVAAHHSSGMLAGPLAGTAAILSAFCGLLDGAAALDSPYDAQLVEEARMGLSSAWPTPARVAVDTGYGRGS
jgi:hypothetical protein